MVPLERFRLLMFVIEFQIKIKLPPAIMDKKRPGWLLAGLDLPHHRGVHPVTLNYQSYSFPTSL